MTASGWIKSSHSGGNGCVEVKPVVGGVLVRHTTNTDGHVLRFTEREWKAFTDGVRDGEMTFKETK